MDNIDSIDSDYIIVGDDGFLGEPFYLSASQKNFVSKYLDLESSSVQEYVLMGTSSSPHYPLFSTICNAFSSYNELGFELKQGSEIIHDQEEGNRIIDVLDGRHLDHNDIFEITSGGYPYTTHDMIQFSK